MALPRFLLTTITATFLVQAFSLVSVPNSVLPLKLLAQVQPASAQNSFYKPPIRPRPTSRTNGTGSRGCEAQTKPIALNLLVPDEHIGQTTAARPTFFWYMENATTARFTLVEPGVPQPLVEQTVQVPHSGIVSLKVPTDAPELAPNKEYRWTVSVLCNPDRPSEVSSFIQSFVVRVAPATELANQLAIAKSPQARARLYASAGYWYDALAEYSKASATDPTAQQEMYSMLEQVGLKDLAPQQNSAAKPIVTQ